MKLSKAIEAKPLDQWKEGSGGVARHPVPCGHNMANAGFHVYAADALYHGF